MLSVIKSEESICNYPKVSEKINLMEEVINDNLEHLEVSKDNDAKTGHKTADTSFFGYKTHIAMTEERIFKTKAKERYKIEAKNSELKSRHGYDTASSSGLIGMELQGAAAIFAVNIKRIIKLLNEK